MGRDKATLAFGGETLLERTVRMVTACVDDVVVVASRGQTLPPLPDAVRVVRDEVVDSGPLGGLGPGLRAIRAPAAFVTSCDAPFVSRAVIDLLFSRLGENDVAVAQSGGFAHPLCAVYRTRCAATVDRFVAENRLRATDLVDALKPVRVDETELRAADPELLALTNCNTPEAYAAALARLAQGGA
jgi:molybdopterin-guanine dinucleotide biosynthesis protein A